MDTSGSYQQFTTFAKYIISVSFAIEGYSPHSYRIDRIPFEKTAKAPSKSVFKKQR